MSKPGWTIRTLHEHLMCCIKSVEKRMHEEFAAVRTLILDKYSSHVREVEQQLAALDKAIIKSETSVEKRFDAVDALRLQIVDQNKTFMPRSEIESAIARINERLKELSDMAATHLTRIEYNSAHERLIEQIRELADAQNKSAGRGTGQAATWGVVVAIIAALGALVSIYVALNHL